MSPRDLLRWVISGSYLGCLQDRVRSNPTYPLAEQVHILVHEVAHVRCDHEGRDIPRSQRETEAESVGSSLYQVGLVGLVPAWRGGLTERRSFR